MINSFSETCMKRLRVPNVLHLWSHIEEIEIVSSWLAWRLDVPATAGCYYWEIAMSAVYVSKITRNMKKRISVQDHRPTEYNFPLMFAITGPSNTTVPLVRWMEFEHAQHCHSTGLWYHGRNTFDLLFAKKMLRGNNCCGEEISFAINHWFIIKIPRG